MPHGIRMTKQGFKAARPVISEHIDPRGKPYYWIGEVREGFRAEGGTDFEAVDEGFVSVTPMRSDLTSHSGIEKLKSWNTDLMNGTAPETPDRRNDACSGIRMVERLRDHYKIADESVLDVMAALPRHLFVPEAIKSQAYNDNALPISGGQTISQPFIVARMTELLELDRQ